MCSNFFSIDLIIVKKLNRFVNISTNYSHHCDAVVREKIASNFLGCVKHRCEKDEPEKFFLNIR